MDDPAGDSSPSSEPSSPSSYEPPPPSSSQQPILLPSTIQPRLPTVEEEEDSPVTERHPPLSAQPLPPLSERSPPPSNEQPSPPTSDEPTNSPMVPPNHLNLRVVYLVTGNPRPPHNIGILHVDTTVSALRERIQESLPEHPSPQHQRLIYHGRPLLRSDATLREVFRIQVSTVPSMSALNTNGEFIGWKYSWPSPVHATYCHPVSARCDHHCHCPQRNRTLESASRPANKSLCTWPQSRAPGTFRSRSAASRVRSAYCTARACHAAQ